MTTTPEDVSKQIHALKIQALTLKKAGDVPGALELMKQIKILQAAALQASQQQQPEPAADAEKPSPQQQAPEKEKEAPPSASKDTDHEANKKEDTETTEKENTDQMDGGEAVEEENAAADEDVEDEDGLLDELQGNDDENVDLDALLESADITFTDAEMLDSEMMTEFKLGGMPVPTDADYRAKILATKQLALKHKNAGDIAAAKEALRRAKQFESVRVALEQMSEGLGLRIHDDADGWLEELNDQESETIGQVLMGGDSGGAAANGGTGNSTIQLNLNDLDEMSPQEIQDAVEMGMELPAVEEVLAQAAEKKALALQNKQAGDLEGAKAALVEFKKLQAGAETLQRIVESMKRGGAKDEQQGEVSMEALESLLDGNNNPKKAAATKQQPPPQKAAPPVRTAEELKQEAVRLRNEKNMKEATQVFKLYKEALKREADAAERKVRREIVDSLQQEIQKAQQQLRLYHYYQRFVDPKVGEAQLMCWQNYAKKCADVAKLVELKGSKSVIITRSATDLGALFMDEKQLTEIVQRGADAADNRLEVAVLNVARIHENKAFQKILKSNKKAAQEEAPNKQSSTSHVLRADVTIQIPPSEEERDKSVELVLESSTASAPESGAGGEIAYTFKQSQFVDVPRGDSKHAEHVLRRMERRKMHISVYHVPKEEEKAKNWFGFGGSSAPAPPTEENAPTLLGKVVLELKDVMTSNCIAGGFPLMRNTNSVGGILELVVRTGVPLVVAQEKNENGDEAVSADDDEAGLRPYEAMSFSVPMEK